MRFTRGRLLKSAAILAVTATAITLAGCQTGGGGGGEDQTLTLHTTMIKGNPMGDVLREQVARFTEESGIEVDIRDVANDDSQTVYEADYLAGKEADVVLTNLVGDNQAWVVDGLTMDVAPLIDEWDLGDRISGAAVDAWTNGDGQTSGFAYQSFVWPIWYNQRIFDEAGVAIPTTYEELVEASAAIRAIGKQPFAVAGGDWPGNNFLTWIGQQYLDADGSVELATNGRFCDPDAKKGIELIADMVGNGVFIDDVAGYTADTMTSAFFNGDAAMMPSGSWAIANAPEDILENGVLAGFPVVDGGAYEKPTMFFGDTSTGVWISRNGQEKLDLVEQFVKFMFEPETIKAFVEGAEMIPSANVEEGSVTVENPLLAQAVELRTNNDGIVLWDTITPVGVDTQATANALYGGASADDTCAALEQIWTEATQ